jgi:tRNA A-37 threonylcarbamoyl transferase component Bud32
LSLKQYLTSPDKAATEKLATIDLLFRQMARRHKIAVQSDDAALIHYDLNSKNIIRTNSDFYFVDFEARPRLRHSVLRSAGNEVLTICKWIVTDIGPDFLKPVAAQLLSAYAEQQNILRCVTSSVLDRHFQFYHRFKDRRRKMASPTSCTKYDIADALAALM